MTIKNTSLRPYVCRGNRELSSITSKVYQSSQNISHLDLGREAADRATKSQEVFVPRRIKSDEGLFWKSAYTVVNAGIRTYAVCIPFPRIQGA